jgi:hypothetical protein
MRRRRRADTSIIDPGVIDITPTTNPIENVAYSSAVSLVSPVIVAWPRFTGSTRINDRVTGLVGRRATPYTR